MIWIAERTVSRKRREGQVARRPPFHFHVVRLSSPAGIGSSAEIGLEPVHGEVLAGTLGGTGIDLPMTLDS